MRTLGFLLLTFFPMIIFESATHHEAGSKSKEYTNQNVQSKDDRQHDAMCCIENTNPSSLPDNSVYQLKSLWKNQDGKTFDISGLRGKVEVVAMFYSHCTYACPLTINNMKKVESSLPKDSKDKVGFVLVSFDPKRDTPSALKALALNQHLDSRTWTLLTGRGADVRSLAAVLGVEFKKKSNGDFLHSSQITVLDTQGKIVFKHLGLSQPVDDVVQAIGNCTGQNSSQKPN